MNEAVETPQSAVSESGKPVVLIVDDDKDIADTYALWLQGTYDVRTAYSGHEALENLSEDIDVVLLDRRMPAVPGDEVLKRIRERDIDCKVSMLTAVEPDSNLKDVDFDDYLVKPVAKSNVLNVVQNMLLRDTLDEDTQEYLALQSKAETIEQEADQDAADEAIVEDLREQMQTIGQEATVRAEVAEYERLKKLTDLMRGINRTLVELNSTEALARNVCEQFVEIDPYVYALFGDYSLTYNQFMPTAASGDADEFHSIDCAPDDPIRTAVEQNAVTSHVSDEIDADVFGKLSATIDHPSETLSFVVIPIRYRENTPRVAVLGADEPVAIEDQERSILEEIGDTLGNAIDSLQTSELVQADQLVELELEITDHNDIFVALAAEFDCRVDLDGIYFGADNEIISYLTIAEQSSDDVVEFLVECDGVDNCRVVDDRGEETLIEATLTGSSITHQLLGASSSISTFWVDDGTGHISVQLPPDANLRNVLESVRSEFDDVNLLSKRTIERSHQSIEGFRLSLEEKLTDRQNMVLEAAFDAGYFDWPRGSTAEEVAESLGMAPPTFHEHHREAQRKLVETYIDETH